MSMQQAIRLIPGPIGLLIVLMLLGPTPASAGMTEPARSDSIALCNRIQRQGPAGC
jgi:hypothetical protein